MKSATAVKIAAQFDHYLDASRERPVLVTRNGKPVAVLVGVQDAAEAKRVASGGPRTLKSILAAADEQLRRGRGIPHDRFWREVERSRGAKRAMSAPARVRRRPA
jgi:prevent-host-death family protein